MFKVDDLPRSLTIQHATLSMLRGLMIHKKCQCEASTIATVDRLIEQHGTEITVRELVSRLSCSHCGRGLGEMAIYLVEGHFKEPCGGPQPGWSLALHPCPPQARP